MNEMDFWQIIKRQEDRWDKSYTQQQRGSLRNYIFLKMKPEKEDLEAAYETYLQVCEEHGAWLPKATQIQMYLREIQRRKSTVKVWCDRCGGDGFVRISALGNGRIIGVAACYGCPNVQQGRETYRQLIADRKIRPEQVMLHDGARLTETKDAAKVRIWGELREMRDQGKWLPKRILKQLDGLPINKQDALKDTEDAGKNIGTFDL